MDSNDKDALGTILRKMLRVLEDIHRDGKTADYVLEEIERAINKFD